MIKVGEILLLCAEHIGRIVHISLRITDAKISLRISNQLRDAEIRTRLVKATSTLEQTAVGSNAQSMDTAALERKVGSVMSHDFCYNGPMVELECMEVVMNPPTAFTKWTNC